MAINSLFGFFGDKFRFTRLVDVPQSLSGQGGSAVRVKADETGLEFFIPSSGTGNVSWEEVTGDRDLDDDDFDGDIGLRVNSSSDVELTLPLGLINTKYLLILREGSGEVSIFADGVTLIAADGATNLRVQGSIATIFPIGSNTYVLSGDIYAP